MYMLLAKTNSEYIILIKIKCYIHAACRPNMHAGSIVPNREKPIPTTCKKNKFYNIFSVLGKMYTL